ncbi:MAG: ATP synthase subunit C [Promethearchaeota archaeon]
MDGKRKFYTLMIAFQFFLLAAVLLSVSGLTGLVAAQTNGSTTTTVDTTGLSIGAGLAIGLSALGAGVAIRTTGTAAISMLSENQAGFMKAFIVVALGEALAIYGLIVAILLWTKIPAL